MVAPTRVLVRGLLSMRCSVPCPSPPRNPPPPPPTQLNPAGGLGVEEELWPKEAKCPAKAMACGGQMMSSADCLSG